MSLKDKIKIVGQIKIETGLHIGGADSFSAIGEADSVVIKESISGNPYIPGSSLKGKMRLLLSKTLNDDSNISVSNDDIAVKRLFGHSGTGDEVNIPARLIVRDALYEKGLSKKSAYTDKNVSTEVKAENTINRVTGVANPRFIERVPKDNYFNFEIVYNLENEDELAEDMQNIANALKLLEWDYLGGSGSRGYGKVKFEEIYFESFKGLEEDYEDYLGLFEF